jgi:hypothetical protein
MLIGNLQIYTIWELVLVYMNDVYSKFGSRNSDKNL